jgi:hypothetical protein
MEAILTLVGNFLELATLKEKRKYADERLRLLKAYREETQKPRPDMARLDNLEYELRLLISTINTASKG